MIKARIRWCSCRVENILTLGKLLRLVLFPPPFYFVFYISNLLAYIQNNFSYELARHIMGTIFLVMIIGERARHSQVCSIENRVYILLVRANFVLITRKEGGA